MKKFYLGMLLSLALVGLGAAQNAGQSQPSPQQGQNAGPQMMGPAGLQNQTPVAKSLDGKLAFVDDQPVIQTKDKTYLIKMPRFYYYAYNDGFKAGDQMKLDGYEIPSLPGQDKPFFLVTKAVINGKTYDFTGAYSMRMLRGRAGMMDDRQGPNDWDDDCGPGRDMGMGRGRR
jgi:hypothetical protein